MYIPVLSRCTSFLSHRVYLLNRRRSQRLSHNQQTLRARQRSHRVTRTNSISRPQLPQRPGTGSNRMVRTGRPSSVTLPLRGRLPIRRLSWGKGLIVISRRRVVAAGVRHAIIASPDTPEPDHLPTLPASSENHHIGFSQAAPCRETHSFLC